MRTQEFIKRKIERHQEEIEELNKVFTELSVEDKKQSNQKTKKKSFTKPKQEVKKSNIPFSIGDYVVIMNNYKGKKGTQGRVTRSICNFTFLIDRYRAVHQRAHHNLDKVTKKHE